MKTLPAYRLTPIQKKVESAQGAGDRYWEKNDQLNKAKQELIGLHQSLIWVVLFLVAAAFTADTCVGFALLSGYSDALALSGALVAAALAVGLELCAGAGFHATDNKFKKAMCLLIGLIPAAAILYVVSDLRAYIAILLGAQGLTLDSKLVVTSAFAFGCHLLLLVFSTQAQPSFNKLKVNYLDHAANGALKSYYANATGALRMAHNIETQADNVGVKVSYDPQTALQLARWRWELRMYGRLALPPRPGQNDPPPPTSGARPSSESYSLPESSDDGHLDENHDWEPVRSARRHRGVR